jgi:hypothetical protein
MGKRQISFLGKMCFSTSCQVTPSPWNFYSFRHVFSMYNYDTAFGIAQSWKLPGYRLDDQAVGVRFPETAKIFSRTFTKFLESPCHHQQIPRLRARVAIRPVLYTSSWRGSSKSINIFYLQYYTPFEICKNISNFVSSDVSQLFKSSERQVLQAYESLNSPSIVFVMFVLFVRRTIYYSTAYKTSEPYSISCIQPSNSQWTNTPHSPFREGLICVV